MVPWKSPALHVVELGGGISAAFATRLLADFGAEVIKVEESLAPDMTRQLGPFRDDDRERSSSGLFMYLNAGKRGVAMELDTDPGRRQLAWLLGEADLVVENLGAGAFDQLVRGMGLDERLVVCSISPYGQAGPKSAYRGSELSAYASGGMLHMTGSQDRPPVKHGYHQAGHLAGVNAAAASLAAVRLARHSGLGQRIDISEQETVAMTIFPALTVCSHTGGVVKRAPLTLPRLATSQAMESSDGWIMPADAGLNVWWESFVSFIGCPELLSDRFLDRGERQRHEGELDAIVAPAFRARTRADLFHGGQEQGLTMSAIQAPDEIVHCQHLAARQFFVHQRGVDGTAVTMPGMVPRTPGVRLGAGASPAPRLGQHNAEVFGSDVQHSTSPRAPRPGVAGSRQSSDLSPLAGVRILELGMVFVLPLAITPLAALGADVIKVESYARPDSVRSGPMPGNRAWEKAYNVAGNFHLLNRNKRGVTLDLTSERGREVLLQLVAKCDVVAENFTPRVLKNLRLTFDDLRRANPKIILLSSTGFGQTGPWQNYKAYGPTTESVDGLMHLTGYADGPPTRGGAGGFGVAFTDVAGAYYGTYAILAALEYRDRTGKGLWLDLSHYEAGVATLPEMVLDYSMAGRVDVRCGNRCAERAPQGVYPCSGEDEWLAVSAGSAGEFRALADVLQLDVAGGEYASLSQRQAAHDLLDELIAGSTRRRDARALEEELQAAGVEATRLASPKDVWLDPQLLSRGFAEVVPAPAYAPGIGPQVYPRAAWLMSRSPARTRTAAPAFGEHTRDVLTELLGLDNDALEQLIDTGVIADSPRPGLISARQLDLHGLLQEGRLREIDADFLAGLRIERAAWPEV